MIIKGRKVDTEVDTDEGLGQGTTLEGPSKWKSAFNPDGIVTAGNGSGINDGAATVVFVSEENAAVFGLRPQEEWFGSV